VKGQGGGQDPDLQATQPPESFLIDLPPHGLGEQARPALAPLADRQRVSRVPARELVTFRYLLELVWVQDAESGVERQVTHPCLST